MHARHAVVHCEPLVQERPRGAHELENAPVLSHDTLEEEIGLPPHREAEVIVEGGEALLVRRDRLERAHLQPLPPELGDEGVCLGVLQHPAHLGLEHAGRAQPARVGQPAEARIRHARPEEVRETGRELVIRHEHRVRGAVAVRRGQTWTLSLEPEQEVRGNQDRVHRGGERLVERVAVRAGAVEHSDEWRQVRRSDGPPVRAAREAAQDDAGACGRVSSVEVAAGIQAPLRLGGRPRLGVVRARDLEMGDAIVVDERRPRVIGVELLAEPLDAIRVRVGRRRELGLCRLRARRRARAAAPRRQPVEECAGSRRRSNARRRRCAR